jgi:cystathionine gamma-lyase
MPYHFDTLAIHAGQPNERLTGAVTTPIYQTSTFAQSEPGGQPEFCYTRTGNPSRSALEANLAALEGARHGLAFASGMAAINNVLNLLKSGDHVVTCRDLYGGAYRIFTKLYQNYGIQFSFVDTTDLAAVRRAFRPETKLLWLETPSNPLLHVTDIAACAAIARSRNAWVLVDNTFATPCLQRPLELGADIVLHSTTKYINGHADVLGGAVLTNRDDLFERLKFFQNAVGAVPAPQDCFLILRGIKTLALRVQRHCENARRIAAFLAERNDIARVYYPGLPDHPNHAVAAQQMTDFGGIISFELADDIQVVRRLVRGLKLWTLAESLGGVKSLLCHPATMTHASVEADVRRARGIRDGLLRLSVGIEHVDDLIEDLRAGLDAAAPAAPVRAREAVPV